MRLERSEVGVEGCRVLGLRFRGLDLRLGIGSVGSGYLQLRYLGFRVEDLGSGLKGSGCKVQTLHKPETKRYGVWR